MCQTLPSLGRLDSVRKEHVIHHGKKCLLSSTITRLADKMRLSTKRLLNGSLTQKGAVYRFSFWGERNHVFFQ